MKLDIRRLAGRGWSESDAMPHLEPEEPMTEEVDLRTMV